MDKIIPHCCPRCNSKKLYKYGKDKFGNQKYQCRICKHQFAPDFISSGSKGAKPLPPEQRKYPSCPICGKAAFLYTIRSHTDSSAKRPQDLLSEVRRYQFHPSENHNTLCMRRTARRQQQMRNPACRKAQSGIPTR